MSEMIQSPSSTPDTGTRRRPRHWKALAPGPLSGTLTFSAQSQLPRLPVPKLEDTFSRLKESLKPIAWSESEYAAVVSKVDEFAKTKLAANLQGRLLARAEEQPHWLEEWWDDEDYLSKRAPLGVNVSYYFGFDPSPSHLSQAPTARAAGIARAAMIFRQQLKQGLLKPQCNKEGPICMDSFRWMFDCCRIPEQGCDSNVTYARQGDTGNSGHIVVVRKNRFWKVNMSEDGKLLSTKDIEKQIQYIYDNTLEEYPAIGILATSDRDVWAKDYGELASRPHNTGILEAIQSAAFFLCLDSSRPADPIQHSRALWHGEVIDNAPVGLCNRWVDKPIQFIVFDNGYAGCVIEHSLLDGTSSAYMCDQVLEMYYSSDFDNGTPSATTIAPPTPLDFETTPAIMDAISKAEKAAAELIEAQDLTYYLTPYGKAAIKAFGVSPDAWAQMIIHLAYHRLLGGKKRMGGTYEASSMRRFYKGRTDAIRAVTSEADAFASSMDDPNASAATRKKMFDRATRKHTTLVNAAGQGQAVDRHMYGLQKLLELDGEALPPLFNDPVFKRSSHWVLTTSAIFSKHFSTYGWGGVEGFGVCYMTGYDDRLQYTITSRKENPIAQFTQEIAKAADDIYNLNAGAFSILH